MEVVALVALQLRDLVVLREVNHAYHALSHALDLHVVETLLIQALNGLHVGQSRHERVLVPCYLGAEAGAHAYQAGEAATQQPVDYEVDVAECDDYYH